MCAEAQVTQAGSFCPHEACPDYGKVDADNLINFGHTMAGTQRRLCKTCGGTFTVTRGTIFYRRRTRQKDIVEALAQLAERGSTAAVAQVKGVKEDTVSAWLGAAAEHWENLESILLKDYRLSRFLLMLAVGVLPPSNEQGLTGNMSRSSRAERGCELWVCASRWSTEIPRPY